ncbi:MAG: Do family serine endopeptidase [Bacteroidales bacterium]|nr:Do family serine endopeptidase [Candidatus Sodaliphilus aphodohippi]
MKKNSKLAIMLISASIVGSATTLMATTALTRAGVDVDTFVPSKNTVKVDDNAIVRTSTRLPDTSTDFTEVAESTVNSVVSIKSFETRRQQQFYGGDWDPFEFFFGPGFGSNGGQRRQQQQNQGESKPQPKGSGSGVIISADGYIVTNNHVIDGAEKLEVTLNDNSKYNATVIGSDPNTDIALIKISAKDLQPVTFGNSDNIKLGQWVLAVGNPFTLNSTVTAGIISAKARGMSESNAGIKAFIQHDAAVNPGNSGGALVNTSGELIGINTMIVSQTGNYSGCSFAVPSNTVKKIVTDIKQYGSVQRAVLGIQYQELDADKAEEHKITATKEGIYVAKVNDLSAAKEAGLQEGDVIVKLNGNSVKNSGEMQEQMNKLRPGDKVTMSYYRDNKLHNTTVTLKNSQGNTKMTKSSDMLTLGCAFTELSDQEKKDLNISKGIKVVGIKAGKFKRAGIKDGFIIIDINNAPVNSREDVENIYNQIMRSNDGDKVMFITGVYPTGKKVYYAVDLSDIDEE